MKIFSRLSNQIKQPDTTVSATVNKPIKCLWPTITANKGNAMTKLKYMFYSTMMLMISVYTSISTANAGALDGLIVQSYKINDAGIQKNNGIDENEFQYFVQFVCYDKRIKDVNHQNLPWFMVLEHYSAADQWLGFVQGPTMATIKANFANRKSMAKIIQLTDKQAEKLEIESRCKEYTSKLSWSKEPNSIYPYPKQKHPRAYYFGRTACFKDIVKDGECNNKIDYEQDGKNKFRYDMKLKLSDYNADEYQLIRVLEQGNDNLSGNTTTLTALFEQFSAQHSISFLDSWPDDPRLSSDNLTYIQQHLAEYKTQNPTTETIEYTIYETTENQGIDGKNWKIWVDTGLVELPVEEEYVEPEEIQPSASSEDQTSTTADESKDVSMQDPTSTHAANRINTPQPAVSLDNPNNEQPSGQSNIKQPSTASQVWNNLSLTMQIGIIILCLTLMIYFTSNKLKLPFLVEKYLLNIGNKNELDAPPVGDTPKEKSLLETEAEAEAKLKEHHQTIVNDKTVAQQKDTIIDTPTEQACKPEEEPNDSIEEAIEYFYNKINTSLTALINESKNDDITQQNAAQLKIAKENTDKIIAALTVQLAQFQETDKEKNKEQIAIVESLQAIIADNQQQNKTLRKTNAEQRDTNKDLRVKNKKLQDEVKQLREDLAQSTAKIDKANDFKNQITAALDHTEKADSPFEDIYVMITNHIETHEQQKTKDDKTIKQLNIDIAKLEILIEPIEDEFIEAKTQLEEKLAHNQTITRSKSQSFLAALEFLSTENDFDDAETLSAWNASITFCCEFLYHNLGIKVIGDLEEPISRFYFSAIAVLSTHGIKPMLPSNTAAKRDITDKEFKLNITKLDDVANYYDLHSDGSAHLKDLLLKDAAFAMLLLSKLNVPQKVREVLVNIHDVKAMLLFIEKVVKHDTATITRLNQTGLQKHDGKVVSGEVLYENI